MILEMKDSIMSVDEGVKRSLDFMSVMKLSNNFY
jgi:hypothetical protein